MDAVISTPNKRRSLYELIEDPKAKENLPSLQSILSELEQLTHHSDMPIERIARIVRTDQSLAVRLLRLANSAYFAPAHPILEIDHAIIYLGLNQVQNTLLTTRCIEKTCNIPSGLLPWRDFWQHAAGVGAITEMLARQIREQSLPRESYYMIGLLHDIGKIVLAALSPNDFDEILQIAEKRQCSTSPVEVELLGLDHASLGGWYLQQQGMPTVLFEPVTRHHTWNLAGNRQDLACIVNLADQMAHSRKIGRSGSYFEKTPDPFQSEEWKNFLTLCIYQDEASFRGMVLGEIDKISAIVKPIID